MTSTAPGWVSRGMSLFSSAIGVLMVPYAVNQTRSGDTDRNFARSDQYRARPADGNVKDVARYHANIFGFALHNFPEVDWDLHLFARRVPPYDHGVILLGHARGAPCQSQHFQGRKL